MHGLQVPGDCPRFMQVDLMMSACAVRGLGTFDSMHDSISAASQDTGSASVWAQSHAIYLNTCMYILGWRSYFSTK